MDSEAKKLPLKIENSKEISSKKSQWVSKTLLGIGKYLISQSTTTSESFAHHRLRMASVDAAKILLVKEVESISKAREGLIEKLNSESEVDRLAAIRGLEQTDKILRQLGVVNNSINYAETLEQEIIQDVDITDEYHDLNWFERFREEAEKDNEEWRKELLSRLLAKKAISSSSTDIELLMKIGTMSVEDFRKFSIFLGLCSVIDMELVIPGSHRNLLSRPIYSKYFHEITIGKMYSDLSELGLVATQEKRHSIEFTKRHYIVYSESAVLIECKKNKIRYKGILLTRLGMKLATLYDPIEHKVGEGIYKEFLVWLSELPTDDFLLSSKLDRAEIESNVFSFW